MSVIGSRDQLCIHEQVRKEQNNTNKVGPPFVPNFGTERPGLDQMSISLLVHLNYGLNHVLDI